MGAEIIAQLSEKAFLFLQAPLQRVTGYDVIVPYAQLEECYLPSVTRIYNVVEQTLEFT